MRTVKFLIPLRRLLLSIADALKSLVWACALILVLLTGFGYAFAQALARRPQGVRPWGWVRMAYGAFPAAAALSAAPEMATTNRHGTRFAAVPTPTSACACTLLGAS